MFNLEKKKLTFECMRDGFDLDPRWTQPTSFLTSIHQCLTNSQFFKRSRFFIQLNFSFCFSHIRRQQTPMADYRRGFMGLLVLVIANRIIVRAIELGLQLVNRHGPIIWCDDIDRRRNYLCWSPYYKRGSVKPLN